MKYYSARELELYTVDQDIRPHSEQAAREISEAIYRVPKRLAGKLAMEASDRGAPNLEQAEFPLVDWIYETVREEVSPVLRKWNFCGATDTEPECNITEIIEKMFKFPEGTLSRWEMF